MTFRQFAFKNVTRNKRLYAAYFLSSMFTVMVFFTFSIFAFHPALNGADINQNVTTGMTTASVIIYVFSFFFVLYSMGSFLQSRKKEFGLLLMQGMSPGQIRMMIFLENMLIGFFATLGGMGLGLVFSKFILLIAENILIISTELYFYVPWGALLQTFASFMLLFFVISMSISVLLRSKKLLHLIQGSKKSKGEPKASKFLAITAAVLLAGGYVAALAARSMQVVAVMIPVVTVVIIGTYLLFTQLSVYIIRKLKKRKSLFWRRTNLILFSDLSFRMKDNARTFFLVAIISTVAFSAIGSLFGFKTVINEMAQGSQAFPFSYTSDEEREEVDADIDRITNTLEAYHLKAEQIDVPLRYYEMAHQDNSVLVVNQSDYNRFAAYADKEPFKADEDSIAVVQPENTMERNKGKDMVNEQVTIGSGVTLQPETLITSNVLPETNPYFVVPDSIYDQLDDPTASNHYYAWSTEAEGEAVIDAGKRLREEFDPGKIAAVDYQLFQLNKVYGPVLFIGLFIGIVFFVAAGSFLYFRLYSNLDEDKEKFQAIAKIGLSQKELNKVLSRQTAILFFTPIVLALIHGAVALTALSHLFMYN